MEILYFDQSLLVCLKPAGVLSTDEPGGLPELLRQALGAPEFRLRTVHRLDRVVGGLMVLACTRAAASNLGRQVMDGGFEKRYLAVVHGAPPAPDGSFTDLLYRDKVRRMTCVAAQPDKDTREARLDYRVLERRDGLSLVAITLHTGRTHQIRVQFSSRGLPLVGERKYSQLPDDCPIALWSARLRFSHPVTGAPMEFTAPPPAQYPWNDFSCGGLPDGF